MSESLSYLPEQRKPSDELWFAVSVIEGIAHRRRGLTGHSPTERIKLSRRNTYNHRIFYDLEYVQQEDGLYWPRVVIHNPAIRMIDWYEQRGENSVRFVPTGRAPSTGQDLVGAMAEQLQVMQHIMQRGGRGVEWQLIAEGR